MAKDPGNIIGYSPCFYFCCFKRPSSEFQDADEIVLDPVKENGKIITEQCDNYGTIEEPEATWSDLADQYSNRENSVGSISIGKEDLDIGGEAEADEIPLQESLLSLSKRAEPVTIHQQDVVSEEEEAVLAELETNLASETIISSDSGPIDEFHVESDHEEESEVGSGDDADDEISLGTPVTVMLPSRDVSVPIVSVEDASVEEEDPADRVESIIQYMIHDSALAPELDENAPESATETVTPEIPAINLEEDSTEEITESPAVDSDKSFKLTSEDSGIVVETSKPNLGLHSKSAVFSDGDDPIEVDGLSGSGYGLNTGSTTSLNSAKKKKFFKFKKLRFKKKKNKNLKDLEMSKSTPSLARMSVSSDFSSQSQSRYSASVLLASLDDRSDEDIARE